MNVKQAKTVQAVGRPEVGQAYLGNFYKEEVFIRIDDESAAKLHHCFAKGHCISGASLKDGRCHCTPFTAAKCLKLVKPISAGEIFEPK